MAISQSNTKWVKKPGQRGYVIDTRTGKKVTGNVRLVAKTTKGKPGEIQKYKAGVGKKARPAAAGGGVMPGKPVPVGTVRKGAAGKRYNKWNGKKWVPVSGPSGKVK